MIRAHAEAAKNTNAAAALKNSANNKGAFHFPDFIGLCRTLTQTGMIEGLYRQRVLGRCRFSPD